MMIQYLMQIKEECHSRPIIVVLSDPWASAHLFDSTVVEMADPQYMVDVVTHFVVKHHGLILLVTLETKRQVHLSLS